MTVDASRPPFLAERLLDAALAGCPYRNDIVGDLHEAYASVLEHHSRRYARCWYCVHALGLAARYAARLRPRVKRANARDRLAIDVRYAGRSLVKRPLMTAAIVLTFALGLGANAAIFGVLNALVLQPFTLPHVDRIVMPVETGPNTSGKRDTVAPATFLDWRSEARGALEHLAAFEWWDANLVGRDQPERVLGFLVSADFFSTLGVQPVLGRGFLTEEETVGHDRRIVLSDGLWRRRFGADTAILGRPIIADGVPSIVVGIMPPGFDFPMGSELWAPLAFDPQTAASRTSDSLTVIGRLASGRRIEDAQAEMSVIADGLARKYPPSNRQRGVRVYSLARGMTDIGLRPILSFCQAVAMVVLLIACANIANLMLARGAERGREIAIRLALGSSRGRIVRDSLVESALLALLAIPLAVAMSWMGLRLMHAFLPAHIGRFVAGWNQMAVDGRVVAFTVLLGSLAALAFGSLTAIQIAPERVAETLKSDTRSGVSPGRERLRRALVVAEMALALPALVAAMLAIASVTRYLTSWQGYDPNGILTAKVVLPDSQYPDDDSRRRFATASLDALTAIPGVRGAAVANVLPSTDSNSSRRIEVAGQPVADPADRPAVDNRTVSAAYFDVLRLPVLAGRAFSDVDQPRSDPVAIVSDSMAQKYWPRGDALGGYVRIGDGPWMAVVGVCGDVIHDWFDRRNAPTLYRPIAQVPTDYLSAAVRTSGDPRDLVRDVRRAFATIDPQQPVFDIMPMRQVLRDKTISIQYVAGVMTTFAGLALILALVGLYAVMTYLVTLRAHEMGVRKALGATAADVTRLALAQATRLTLVGLGLGLALAFALSRLMEAGMLGIVSTDLRMAAVVAVTWGTTAVASSYLPARRAAAVDPIVALRAE